MIIYSVCVWYLFLYNYAVSLLHEQAVHAATSIPITSVARHFPTSVLSQEQRDDYRPLPVLHFSNEDKAYPVRLLFYLCTKYFEMQNYLLFLFSGHFVDIFSQIFVWQLLTKISWFTLLQGATDKQQTENGVSLHEEKASNNFGQLGFEQQLLQWPDLRQL